MQRVAGTKKGIDSASTRQRKVKEGTFIPVLTGIYLKFVQTKSQSAFLVIFAIVAVGCFPLFRIFNELVESRRAKNPSYDWPKYSDFWVAFVSAAVIFLLRNAFSYVFFPLYMRCLAQKLKGKARLERAEKGAKSVFKCFYFIGSCILGWYVLKDVEFMPKSLFCNGDISKTYKDFPYFKKSDYFNYYYLIQCGYHLESLFSQLFSKPRNDYVEMMLHHVVAVLLIFLSYMSNFSNVGAPVLFLHDWSDIFTASSRLLLDVPGGKIPTVISFFTLIGSWIWTRLYVFPFEVIRLAAIKYMPRNIFYSYTSIVLVSMLLVLLLLHIYWFYLLMRIVYTLVVEKKQEDLQNKLEEEDTPEEKETCDDVSKSKKD